MRRNVQRVFNVLLVVVATAAVGGLATAQEPAAWSGPVAVAAGVADVDLRRRRC